MTKDNDHQLTPEARLERASRMISDGVQEMVRALTAPKDSYDQYDSPLGKRRHLTLARQGKFPSVKSGKRVVAKREDVWAYMKREGLSRGERADDEDVDAIVDTITKGGRG